jgi:hypothetical protein
MIGMGSVRLPIFIFGILKKIIAPPDNGWSKK